MQIANRHIRHGLTGRRRRNLAINRDRLVFQIWVRANVCHAPFVFAPLELAFGADVGDLAAQRHFFGRSRDPIVVHARWVFGVARDTAANNLAVDVQFLAVDGNDGQPLAHDLRVIDHFKRRALVPLQNRPLSRARAHDLGTVQRLQLRAKARGTVTQFDQLIVYLDQPVVLGNAHQAIA